MAKMKFGSSDFGIPGGLRHGRATLGYVHKVICDLVPCCIAMESPFGICLEFGWNHRLEYVWNLLQPFEAI